MAQRSRCKNCTWDLSGNLLYECLYCYRANLVKSDAGRNCECGAAIAKTTHSRWCPAYPRKQTVHG